jgi:hypothetical protein
LERNSTQKNIHPLRNPTFLKMQSHDNENRLADLQELATRLTNNYDVRTGTAREVPIVMGKIT